jgi:hypothetical protein
MRLFQNSAINKTYLARLRRLTKSVSSFSGKREIFLADRFGASHFLKPVLDGSSAAFFTNGDDEQLQRAWAVENGLSSRATLEDILLVQMEQHRAEVFYNLDPIRYGSAFLRKLPGCVKNSIAWRAAPSPGADFSAYNLIVCNFPGILRSYAHNGWRTAYFTPAHDPEMDAYAHNEDRPIDILFVGGYSRHHRRRAEVLEAVARLRERYRVQFHLDRSRMTRLAETPVGLVGPLKRYRRPKDIRHASHEPVFGRDLYQLLSHAKIVLNGAIDMAGEDRGNMRCWETLGCAGFMVSDNGCYPDGFFNGRTIVTYGSAAQAVGTIVSFLEDSEKRNVIAQLGFRTIRELYSKEKQWQQFCRLL